MATSIRSRIVLTLVSALIVAGLVASWATYHSTRTELSGLFDAQLRHTALELIERGDIYIHDLRDMIMPVDAVDVVDDLAAALITKVNINIRHTDALRI